MLPKTTLLLALLISALLNVAVGHADSSCLPYATNQELLSELNRRLSTGNTPNFDSMSVSFTCGDSAKITATAVNLSSGQSTTVIVSTGNWDICKSTVNLLNSKIGNIPFQGGRVFAICAENATAKKFVISPAAPIKEIESAQIGDWTRCRDLADQINSGLKP